MLDWSLSDAIKATSLSSSSLNRAENKNARDLSDKMLRLLTLMYEQHGIEFINDDDGIGVKLKKSE